jgi:hypothetical protein
MSEPPKQINNARCFGFAAKVHIERLEPAQKRMGSPVEIVFDAAAHKLSVMLSGD